MVIVPNMCALTRGQRRSCRLMCANNVGNSVRIA